MEGAEEAPLSISMSPWETVLPVPITLVPKGVHFLTRNTRIPLTYKLWLLFGHFGLFVSSHQQATRGFPILAGVNDLDQQEEEGLLSHNEQGKIHADPG